MDDQTKEDIYEVLVLILSIGLLASIFALVYSHRWIVDFEGPASDLVLLISDSAESEYGLMQDIRLASGILSIIITAGIIGVSYEYEELEENSERENKKGIIAGIVVTILAISGYLYASHFPVESILLAGAIYGTIITIVAVVFLLIGE